MLSDMALDEGSGGYSDDNLNDDEDYVEGSGDDGSGDGSEFPFSYFLPYFTTFHYQKRPSHT